MSRMPKIRRFRKVPKLPEVAVPIVRVDPFASPADVLRAAAKLIEQPGAWVQNRFSNRESTSFCAVGALYEVTYDPRLVRQAASMALSPRTTHSPSDSLIKWNDMPGRTQVEVVNLLNDGANRWDSIHAH